MNSYITFNLNGNFLSHMVVREGMMFCEVLYHFCKTLSLKENEASFFFNSKEIKSDSTRKLKALGIKNWSVIDVKTKIPIKNQMYSNFGSMGMNPYSNMEQQNFENQNGVLKRGTNDIDKDTPEFLNVVFNLSGKIIVVQATENTKFSELINKFCLLANVKDRYPAYLHNSRIIEPTESKTLKELKIQNQQIIEAFFQGEVIGK